MLLRIICWAVIFLTRLVLIYCLVHTIRKYTLVVFTSRRVSGFGTSDEAEAIENLLDAYDQSDAERIKTIVAKPLFRNLDNEVPVSLAIRDVFVNYVCKVLFVVRGCRN